MKERLWYSRSMSETQRPESQQNQSIQKEKRTLSTFTMPKLETVSGEHDIVTETLRKLQKAQEISFQSFQEPEAHDADVMVGNLHARTQVVKALDSEYPDHSGMPVVDTSPATQKTEGISKAGDLLQKLRSKDRMGLRKVAAEKRMMRHGYPQHLSEATSPKEQSQKLVLQKQEMSPVNSQSETQAFLPPDEDKAISADQILERGQYRQDEAQEMPVITDDLEKRAQEYQKLPPKEQRLATFERYMQQRYPAQLASEDPWVKKQVNLARESHVTFNMSLDFVDKYMNTPKPNAESKDVS